MMICPFCYDFELEDDGALHVVTCPKCGDLDRLEVEQRHSDDARDDAVEAAIDDIMGR